MPVLKIPLAPPRRLPDLGHGHVGLQALADAFLTTGLESELAVVDAFAPGAGHFGGSEGGEGCEGGEEGVGEEGVLVCVGVGVGVLRRGGRGGRGVVGGSGVLVGVGEGGREGGGLEEVVFVLVMLSG